MKYITSSIVASVLVGLVGLTAVACSDDDITPPPSTDPTDTPDAGGTPTTPDTDGGSVKPVYALGILQSSSTGSTTYMQLLDNLDAQGDVALTTAREFAGYAPAAAVGGKMLMNDGESPRVTRFAIGEDKSWTEETSLSFANFATASLGSLIVANDTVAYTPFDAFSYVAWNPATFALGAELTDPANIPATRNGLNVNRGYGHDVVGNYAFQPFYWANGSFSVMDRTSTVAVLDTTTNRWAATTDVQCPHLHITSKDEAGNLYISPGQYSVPQAVVDAQAPRNCMIRINAGQTTPDASFTFDIASVTGGLEGSNFFYVGNNVGFFNVFDPKADPTATTVDAIRISSKYHLWTYNLTTRTAAITQGIDFAGGQYTSFRIDNRVFLAMPAGDYSSTTVYELLTDGTAKRLFATQGWTFNMFRVR